MAAHANEPKRPTTIAVRRNLHGQIAEYLGMQILDGKLQPGEILPNEPTLATSLDVSRTAIREAIKVLASKGLIEVRRKTGTRVRPRRGMERTRSRCAYLAICRRRSAPGDCRFAGAEKIDRACGSWNCCQACPARRLARDRIRICRDETVCRQDDRLGRRPTYVFIWRSLKHRRTLTCAHSAP